MGRGVRGLSRRFPLCQLLKKFHTTVEHQNRPSSILTTLLTILGTLCLKRIKGLPELPKLGTFIGDASKTTRMEANGNSELDLCFRLTTKNQTLSNPLIPFLYLNPLPILIQTTSTRSSLRDSKLARTTILGIYFYTDKL